MSRRLAPLAFLVPLTTAVPAWAHHGEPVAERALALPPATPTLLAPASPWPLLLLAAALLIVSVGSRRARASVTAGLLLLFAFEGAIHSVHHIGENERQGRCAVESASSHLGGILVAPIDVASRPLACETMPLPETVDGARPALRADRQRAPPSLA